MASRTEFKKYSQICNAMSTRSFLILLRGHTDHNISSQRHNMASSYREGRAKTSVAWDHFEIKDADLGLATCNYCYDTFSYRTSVSNLKKHLTHKHRNVLCARDEDETDTEKSECNTIKVKKMDVWDYFEIKDGDCTIATCTLCSEDLSCEQISTLSSHLKENHAVVIEKDEIADKSMNYDESDTEHQKTRGRAKSSVAWDYFEIKDAKARLAACNLCSAVLSYRTSVSNLVKHVKRRHDIEIYKEEDVGLDADDDGTDVESNTPIVSPTRTHRSIVWLYFKCVDPERKLAQCLICKKLIVHSTTLTNLKKHLARKHPHVKIPGREDGSKRILLSSGGELYEVEAANPEDLDNDEDNQMDTVQVDTVYLEDYETLDQESPPKKIRKIKTVKREQKLNDSSSDEEVTFFKKYSKKEQDSLDYFGKYIISLLKQLPKEISNQLQTDFVKQIMNAHLTYETQKTELTDSKGNAYSITITADAQDTIVEKCENVTAVNNVDNK